MLDSVQEIEGTELSELMASSSQNLRIVDVRETHEHMQGIVPGSELVPLATLPGRLNEFAQDEKLIMVCRSGARSAQACLFLQQQGFGNVFNLRGGMLDWAERNLPIAEFNPVGTEKHF